MRLVQRSLHRRGWSEAESPSVCKALLAACQRVLHSELRPSRGRDPQPVQCVLDSLGQLEQFIDTVVAKLSGGSRSFRPGSGDLPRILSVWNIGAVTLPSRRQFEQCLHRVFCGGIEEL